MQFYGISDNFGGLENFTLGYPFVNYDLSCRVRFGFGLLREGLTGGEETKNFRSRQGSTRPRPEPKSTGTGTGTKFQKPKPEPETGARSTGTVTQNLYRNRNKFDASGVPCIDDDDGDASRVFFAP